MKFTETKTTLAEMLLTDGDLDEVRGAADEAKGSDWTTAGPYLEVRANAQREMADANRDAWSSFFRADLGGVYDGFTREVEARKELHWAEENLNSINHGKADAEQARADRLETLEQLQKQEQAEHEAEEKRERERQEELKRYLDSEKQPTEQEVRDFVRGNGGGGGTPANDQPYGGPLPSIPSHLVNAPPSHVPQIIIEPIDVGSY